MAGRFTVGERRGLIVLLILLAVVVGFAVVNIHHRASVGMPTLPADTAATKPPLEAVAAKQQSDSTAGRRQRPKKEKNVNIKGRRSAAQAPSRSPLDEHNN